MSTPHFSYRVYPDHRCVVTRVTGEFRVPLFVKGMDEIFADESVTPDMSYLHDWRQAWFSPSMDFRSLSGYARVQGERLAGGRVGVRVAVVLGDGEAFGVTRQAIVLLEPNTTTGIERRPFMDMAEACAWLGVDPAVLAPEDDAP